MKKKHIVVIGGTRGIGRVIAERFALVGHIVSVVGRKQRKGLNRIHNNLRYYLADISRKDLRENVTKKILKERGHISHLIFAQKYRGEDDNWQGEIEVSLTATKKIIELFLDHFDNIEEKSIVIISSIASDFVCLEQPLGYHIGKAGLNQMVKYYTVTLGKKGIRINSISPAVVVKDESRDFYRKNKKLLNIINKNIPLGRMGTPEDIADAAEFLCSTKSSYITGQNIVVDGGLSLMAQEGLIKDIILDRKGS